MPKEIYPDVDYNAKEKSDKVCGNTIELFDGPAFCARKPNHEVNVEQLHQENLEGWAWNDVGRIW